MRRYSILYASQSRRVICGSIHIYTYMCCSYESICVCTRGGTTQHTLPCGSCTVACNLQQHEVDDANCIIFSGTARAGSASADRLGLPSHRCTPTIMKECHRLVCGKLSHLSLSLFLCPNTQKNPTVTADTHRNTLSRACLSNTAAVSSQKNLPPALDWHRDS